MKKDEDRRQRYLKGFDDLPMVWSDKWGKYSVKIDQGGYCIAQQDIVITTILGSCISVCVYDIASGWGGMNHFLLPEIKMNMDRSQPLKYGIFSMEKLINSLLKKGCLKHELSVKVVGGGRMIRDIQDIGRLNVEFINQYIKDEELLLMSQDVGGDWGRKLLFFPVTGRVLVKKIPNIEEVIIREQRVARRTRKNFIHHEIELF